jgi:hypothetical protein
LAHFAYPYAGDLGDLTPVDPPRQSKQFFLKKRTKKLLFLLHAGLRRQRGL